MAKITGKYEVLYIINPTLLKSAAGGRFITVYSVATATATVSTIITTVLLLITYRFLIKILLP